MEKGRELYYFVSSCLFKVDEFSSKEVDKVSYSVGSSCILSTFIWVSLPILKDVWKICSILVPRLFPLCFHPCLPSWLDTELLPRPLYRRARSQLLNTTPEHNGSNWYMGKLHQKQNGQSDLCWWWRVEWKFILVVKKSGSVTEGWKCTRALFLASSQLAKGLVPLLTDCHNSRGPFSVSAACQYV